MEIFTEIIHPIVLKRLKEYSDQTGAPLEELYRQIKEKIGDLSNKYKTGREDEIDYGDPLTRLAYLYTYVPGLSACLTEVLFSVKQTFNFEEYDEIRCLVFGGGPGTELISMAKVFENEGIKFFLTDKEAKWYDCWYEIRDRIKYLFPDRKIQADSTEVDLCNVDDFERIKYATQHSQFVFFNYVVSELYKSAPHFFRFLEQVFTHLPSKAIIVIVDRSQREIINLINCLIKEFNLHKTFGLPKTCRTDEDFKGELVQKIGTPPRGKYFQTYQIVAVKP